MIEIGLVMGVVFVLVTGFTSFLLNAGKKAAERAARVEGITGTESMAGVGVGTDMIWEEHIGGKKYQCMRQTLITAATDHEIAMGKVLAEKRARERGVVPRYIRDDKK